MKKKIISIFLICVLFPAAVMAAKPHLVVNIVISQMRYDYLTRFGENMSNGGFNKFLKDGVVFTDARYNFMQTTTPATLATLTTGADPSTHGIVGTRWIDYTLNTPIDLIEDYDMRGLDCDYGIGQYSPHNLTVPTLGDRLKEQNPASKVITVALDPVSAIVAGGNTASVYWMDETRGNWISSTACMEELPGWVERYNGLRIADNFLDYNWMLSRTKDQYINTAFSIFDFEKESRFKKIVTLKFLKRKDIPKDYPAILRTPIGNSLVTEFAKQAIIYEELGNNDNTDLINIIYDSPRYIGELFGGESMEVEDMLYRLDEDIEELVSFIGSHTDLRNVMIVLTSDHGASDSYDYKETPRERFNTSQFKVIMNGFMNTQYGPGDWVIDYVDRQLYLNRNLVYSNNLSLEEVQNRVAAFALQFRGISHVLTSTALQNSSFNGGYAEKMQNSFYPKRSGDITINLMPGWIEESDDKRSTSGSMYEYDTHVPLMILLPGFPSQKISRTVNMRDVAPTLARIMQISRPIAAEGEPVEEIAKFLD